MSGLVNDANARLMRDFCSIGGNCEFGFAQQRCGANPIDLLRWAASPYQHLLHLLRDRCEGIGNDLQIHLQGEEFMVISPRYGIKWHAFVNESEMKADPLLKRVKARLPRLADFFIETLTLGERIFVRVPDPRETHDRSLSILAAIREYGPGRLLVVKEDPDRLGDVEEVEDGMLIGYIDKLCDASRVPATTRSASWLTLCQNVRKRYPLPSLAAPQDDADAVEFDEKWYLYRYRDVAETVQQNPHLTGLSHYLAHGRREGRLPVPPATWIRDALNESGSERNPATINCEVEQPRPDIVANDPVWVSGWAFGTEAVKEVAVSIDKGPFELAQYGQRRADVFAHNPDSPHSEYCGFRAGPFTLDARKRASPSVELVVRVALETGETADTRKQVTVHPDADSFAQALLKDIETAASALISGASGLMGSGRSDHAAKLIEKLFFAYPNNVDALACYANAMMAKGRPQEAIEYFEAAEAQSNGARDFSEAVGRARFAAASDAIDTEAAQDHKAIHRSGMDAAAKHDALLMRFESLGFNCEFGIVQRWFGAGPLGLLRFADSPLDLLLQALHAKFEGVGDDENTVVKLYWGNEYGVADSRYNLKSHTFIYADKAEESAAPSLKAKLARRMRFLARKLVEDLTEAEKIFVYYDYSRLSDEDCQRLFSALQAYGPNKLLCVRAQEEGRPAGTIEQIGDRLMIGYLANFAQGGPANLQSWLELCEKANRAFAELPKHDDAASGRHQEIRCESETAMTPLSRDDIITRIWRGNDPLLQHPRNLIRTDPQGFNSHHRYLTNAIDALAPPVIVEIGVWKGASTVFMAQHMKARFQSGVVIAVDTWLGSAEHWLQDGLCDMMGFMNGYPALYHTFIANVLAAGVGDHVVPLPLDSLNAAAVLTRMNIRPAVIHLDGAHDHASVMADLRAWWPLLLPGGELIGDDYSPLSDWVGVKQAFDEFFGAMGYPSLEYEGPKCRVRKS